MNINILFYLALSSGKPFYIVFLLSLLVVSQELKVLFKYPKKKIIYDSF